MKSLAQDIKMPIQISRETDMLPNHVTVALQELMSHELIEWLNPGIRKGKLFTLTDKGKMIIDNWDAI